MSDSVCDDLVANQGIATSLAHNLKNSTLQVGTKSSEKYPQKRHISKIARPKINQLFLLL